MTSIVGTNVGIQVHINHTSLTFFNLIARNLQNSWTCCMLNTALKMPQSQKYKEQLTSLLTKFVTSAIWKHNCTLLVKIGLAPCLSRDETTPSQLF